MISYRLQFLLVLGSILCLIILLNLIRKYKLELRYSMLWLVLITFVTVLSIFPKSFVIISEAMGIELAVNALFLLAIFSLYTIIFSLTLTLSKSVNKIQSLSQELGLLKHEINELKKKLPQGGTHK
ncbi:DUF2304 domain-containing protein [Paenibacillus sp. NPDC093718]|uniref:DUF2304 domain-containing protein n=1 Tax=Paenibacillus sp. NPDC093718 TaxID=3390601 RepID=UPI003D030DC0